MLYRTDDGRLLTSTDGQEYTGGYDGSHYYAGADGPVEKDGTPIPGHVVTKFAYTPEEYLAAFPQGERYRRWLTEKSKGAVTFVIQCEPYWCCIPGNFCQATAYPGFDHPQNPRWSQGPKVNVNDGDDCDYHKKFDTFEEALAGLEELKLLAPFNLPDLKLFGYELH